VASNVSRDTFIPSRGYQELIFSQQRPVLDSELNEQQDVFRRREELVEKSGIGNGAIGDGYQVLASGSPNSILIYQGTYYNAGRELTLFNNVLLTGLTTPGVNRTDYAYIEYYDEEIDGVDDPNIIDPVIGIETACRKKTAINLKVVEGAAIPAPAAGRVHVQVATLQRLAANPNITTAMITDDRKRASRNFVVSGLRPAHAGGLTYTVTAGSCYVANAAHTVGAAAGAIPAGVTRYIYIDTTGTLQVAAALPTTFNAPIAQLVSNGTTITSLTDLRMFSNLATDTPRIDVSINTDGTIREGTISLENINILRPHEQTVPDMTIYVEEGTYIATNGQSAITFAGGSSPVFAVPVGNSKIDLLTIDDSGNLVVEPGTPAAIPVPPVYPTDKQVIAEITIAPGATQILNAQIRDVRGFLNMAGGLGVQISRDDFASSAGQTVFALGFSYSPGSHDLLVFSAGQIQTQNVDYLESSSSSITFLAGRVAGERVSAIRISGSGSTGGGSAPALYYFYTAIGGETLITFVAGSYTPNNNSIRVYRNGKKLTNPNDYTEPSSTQVLLAVAAVVGDVFEFIVEAGSSSALLQPRSVPIQAFSADPSCAPTAGVISGIISGSVAIDTIDFSNLITQRIKFTVASPRDVNILGTYGVSLQLWLTSGLTVSAGGQVFVRVNYAVIDDSEDVLLGGNRHTVTITVAPFGTAINTVRYVDLPLVAADFTSNTTFIAFTLERDVTDPADTYTDVMRLCEMRFKYVSV